MLATHALAYLLSTEPDKSPKLRFVAALRSVRV
jgi:hypothetical protein